MQLTGGTTKPYPGAGGEETTGCERSISGHLFLLGVLGGGFFERAMYEVE
jgi:hypothetical protein